ncbi:MAG: DUF2283 domain-containing protein [Dehalococcoidia bacterium]|nr:DUF2283 domain-containing protein [Dehalococcoidia bacterium]
MRVKVDLKNDALYLRLDESAIVGSEEVKPGVILDYDANDNVIGVEMLGVSKWVPAEMLEKVKLEKVGR